MEGRIERIVKVHNWDAGNKPYTAQYGSCWTFIDKETGEYYFWDTMTKGSGYYEGDVIKIKMSIEKRYERYIGNINCYDVSRVSLVEVIEGNSYLFSR